MNQRIIFPNSEGTVCVLIPTGEISVNEVSRKDVPAGVPYLVINAADIPTDRTFRSAWQADFSNPDGYGIGAEAWFKEQEAKQL